MQLTAPAPAPAAGSIVDRVLPGWFRPVPDLPTVASVDLQRYSGEWFELARLPTRFQNPASVSTATYTPRPDGSVTVFNQAFLGAERVASITGRASVAAGSDGARLRVKFGGLLSLIPTQRAGNYYVLDLADDYSLALVGSPDRSNLWLLGRDPKLMDTARAAAMVQKATDLGYDTAKLAIADWTERRMRTGSSPA